MSGQRGRPRGSKYEYALYKGEEFLDIGTAVFLANKFGLKEKTIRWLAFCRRKERLNHKSGYVVVPLGEETECTE